MNKKERTDFSALSFKISVMKLFSEVSLKETSECFSVSCFVSCHFMNCESLRLRLVIPKSHGLRQG